MISKTNDKYLYHYYSTLPRVQWFLWTPLAQQNLVVRSSPLAQFPQGDLDDLWHPKHTQRISYRLADHTAFLCLCVWILLVSGGLNCHRRWFDFNTFDPCLPLSPILPGLPSGPFREKTKLRNSWRWSLRVCESQSVCMNVTRKTDHLLWRQWVQDFQVGPPFPLAQFHLFLLGHPPDPCRLCHPENMHIKTQVYLSFFT